MIKGLCTMNSLTIYSILFVCIGHSFASLETSLDTRDNRQFSLFSVVTFKNSECTAKSAGIKGVCFTTTECTDKGGTADGNCASAFGVCCILKVSACGSSLSTNCTYIENPGYPSTLGAATTSCAYTVTKCATDICQVRLDFTAVTLKQPSASTDADCSTDSITIRGAGEASAMIHAAPPLCGTLTGQHVYLDAGHSTTNAATLTFVVAASGTSSWRIKVSQIACWSPWRAPNGCLQYFTGNSNTVTSFNWSGDSTCSTGCWTSTQSYTVCFRPEEGMCGVNYQQSTVSSSLLSFDTFAGGTTSLVEILACDAAAITTGYISIENDVTGSGDIFCGLYLNTVTAHLVAGTVYGTDFDFYVVAGATNNANAGFSIEAVQRPCSHT